MQRSGEHAGDRDRDDTPPELELDASLTFSAREILQKRDFEKMFITTSDSAAKVILDAVRANRRRVLIGPDAKAIDLMVRLMPEGYQRLISFGAKWQRRKAGETG